MSDKRETIHYRIELLAAILMSAVVIATAWSAYQSTLWGGIQTFAIREVNSAGNKVTMYTLEQGQHTLADVMMFMEYVKALDRNDKFLSEFYFERFRPEFKPAVEAWLATNPFENPDAPPHPFVMPEYRKMFSEKAERFAAEQQIKLHEAEQANHNSDNYVLMTVIYAGILFISGIIDRFSHHHIRLKLVVVGWIMFSIVTFFVLTMPIAPLFE